MGKNKQAPRRNLVMTCLSRIMHLPPKLRKSKPTNPLDRFKQVGPFIFWNLSHALLSPPHYETSMYGAANGYLYGIFPLDRYFMVKPQGMIRPIFDAEGAVDNATVQQDTNEGGAASAPEEVQEDVEDDAAANILDTSIGSYLGGHLARGQGKREVGKDFVDFVVVKVAVSDAESKVHIPLVLIEMKKTYVESDSRAAEDQLCRYMKHMALQPACPKDLVGYLIQAQKGMRFHLIFDPDGTFNSVGHGAMFDILASDTMTPELIKIARENWDFVGSAPDVQP